LLNTVKITFPAYLIVGNELALDEASVSSRSRFGSQLIFFNPSKPGGKFHFRFYMLCDADTYACLRLRVHTRNKSDVGDPRSEGPPTLEENVPDLPRNDVAGPKTTGESDDDEVHHEDANTQTTGLLVALVLDMCKPYFGSGRVVNMDNYYTSPEVAYTLSQNGLYMRGTCRTNRKGFPVGVLYSKGDSGKLDRGSTKTMMEHEKGITAYGWLDGNPVHFLTTADGNTMSQVSRRIGKERKWVAAPTAIKKYNKGMQAVDRHDQLRTTFSLADRHGFKKYYVKMALGIIDMAIVNAWIHFKMANPEICNNNIVHARSDFIDHLADQLINTKWKENMTVLPDEDGKEIFEALCDRISVTEDDNVDDIIDDDGDLYKERGIASSQRMDCIPKAVKKLLVAKSSKRKGLGCQICTFEGRPEGTIGSVVICLKHRIRCCTETREQPDLKKMDGSAVTDYSWRTPQKSMSCWAKAHSFYIGMGLFKNDVDPLKEDEVTPDNLDNLKFQCSRVGSDLNKRKKKALGIVSKRGRKKQKVMETSVETELCDTTGDQKDEYNTCFL
jgi:Transposase IS4